MTDEGPRTGPLAHSMDRVTSTKNPVVNRVRKLHRARGRKVAGQVLVEGPSLVADARAAGLRPMILVTEEPQRWTGSAELVLAVDRRVLEACSTTATPQDPVAVIARPETVAAGPRRLVAWGIADPGNLGTMIRTAAAVGVEVVVGGPGSADPWAPKVVRSGAGAHFTVALEEVAHFEDALGGREGLALVVSGGTPPESDPDGSWGLVVGSEAHGLPAEVVAACRAVTLPMPGGTESLNAAVAAAVALYSLAV